MLRCYPQLTGVKRYLFVKKIRSLEEEGLKNFFRADFPSIDYLTCYASEDFLASHLRISKQQLKDIRRDLTSRSRWQGDCCVGGYMLKPYGNDHWLTVAHWLRIQPLLKALSEL